MHNLLERVLAKSNKIEGVSQRTVGIFFLKQMKMKNGLIIPFSEHQSTSVSLAFTADTQVQRYNSPR
nr:MAG: hypothetical protein AM325_08300 [Candidatus Thorarchaeota archaeon SMTZ1-45]